MTHNSAIFEYADLVAIFGKHSLVNIGEEFGVLGVSIDSRTIKDGNLFVALKGETIDGHTKAIEAIEKGASAILVEKSWFDQNQHSFDSISAIVVKDTLVALGDLALYHRNRFDLPIVAVAGSNGKTTTKDMIAHLLSKKYEVLKTYKNFNNRLGVPLMLLMLNDDYSAAVIEIGTNEPGEVFALAHIVAPESGIITNIGKEHLEKLIDLDGVETEETSLFAWLMRHGKISFINLDDHRLAKYAGIIDKKFTYSSSGEANLIADISIDNELKPILIFKFNEEIKFEAQLQTIGLASAYNALSAVAVALYYDVEVEKIIEGLEDFRQDEYVGYARMALQLINGFEVLNDCYNANPSSMLMSLKTLDLYQTDKRKFAVLGDMRELGEASDEEHIEVLKNAVEICEVLAIGSEMGKACRSISHERITHFLSFEELAAFINANYKNSVFLLKGSRGMKMENLLEELKK